MVVKMVYAKKRRKEEELIKKNKSKINNFLISVLVIDTKLYVNVDRKHLTFKINWQSVFDLQINRECVQSVSKRDTI